MKFPAKIGKVKIYLVPSNSNYFTYRLYWKVGKTTKTRNFSNKEKAIEEAKNINHILNEGATRVTAISGERLEWLSRIQQVLGDADLHEVKQACEELRARKAAGLGGSGAKLYPLYVRELEVAGRSPRHVATCRSHLKELFEGELKDTPFRTITTQDISSFLESKDWKPKTRNQKITTYRAFWSWCQRNGYWDPNTPCPASGVLRPTVVSQCPEVFSVGDMVRMLEAAPLNILPYLALGAFGGLRSSELSRVTWEMIDWEAKELWLTGSVTKTGRRRCVPLSDNLIAWLKLCPEDQRSGLIVKVDPPQRYTNRLVKRLGIEWRANGLRKSFVSYHLALHENAPKTALITGHSTTVLERDYKALVRKWEAKAWFEIFPKD